jgi:hypothetical protein
VSAQRMNPHHREVRSDLINQTGVECADPWLIATRAYGIAKFDVAAEIPDDRARQPDGILPLHAHATAARLIENVDPLLTEKRETPRQRIVHR